MRLIWTTLLVCCSLAAAAEAILAPDSAALHNLFGTSTLASRNRTGNPDSETFHAPEDIQIVVMYGSDHHACLVTLEPEIPPPPPIGKRQFHQMSSQKVAEVLDEIAPLASRGKLLGGGAFCGGSPGGILQEYEGVSIRGWLRCGEPESESKATIYFKRDICPKP